MVLDSLLAGVMLFSSFAARTPNAQPNPDDYEVSIGISNDNFIYISVICHSIGINWVFDIN